MIQRFLFSVAALLLIAATDATAQTINNLSPNTIPAGSADFALTVNGTFDITPPPIVYWTFNETITQLATVNSSPLAGGCHGTGISVD